jgi:AcrR family transcriptional regulator
VTDTSVLPARIDGQASIRNEPVQARSTARLAALLDAAAHVIDEIGYERLTTAMVAEGAGASIGTVYRYFPDRIAVLQSLAARNVERVGERAIAALKDTRHERWQDALGAAFRAFTDAFHDEPGFASLRFGDVLDLRPLARVPVLHLFAERLAVVLVERFGMSDDEQARLALQSAVTIADAVAADAFRKDPQGEDGVLRQAGSASEALLGEYFPASQR